MIKWANVSLNHIWAPSVRFCCSFILLRFTLYRARLKTFTATITIFQHLSVKCVIQKDKVKFRFFFSFSSPSSYWCCYYYRCSRSVLVAVFWSAPGPFSYPFPYAANLTCFSLLRFLDVDQTHTKKCISLWSPIYLQNIPLTRSGHVHRNTHRRVRVPAHTCRNNHPPCL